MIDDHTAYHVTDDDLLLDYYGERSPESHAAIHAHLAACAACRALDHEVRGVLALVDTTAIPEPPIGFERDVWASIEPRITASARPVRTLWWTRPRWVLAGGMAALLVAAFALGRVWDRPPVVAPSSVADARAVNERLLRTEVEDHLERSQRALVELVNADDAAPESLTADRVRAADLVAAGRLYRRSAEEIGDAETRDLLEDVERVLVEVANGSPDASSKDLSSVRTRIGEQDLIVRLRMAASEMRERERRARPTW